MVEAVKDDDPEQLLLEWEQCTTPRQIALLRARCEGRLAACFVSLLRDALATYLLHQQSTTNDEANAEESTQPPSIHLQNLHRLVLIHWNWVRQDPTILGEELGRQGSHAILAKWMKHCSRCCLEEIDDDDDNLPARETMILEVHDKACEIAALCRSFPVPTMPFTAEELQARLPLVFRTPIRTAAAAVAAAPLCASFARSRDDATTPSQASSAECGITTLIQQVTSRQSAQADVGFVTWPSAVVLSHWLAAMASTSTSAAVVEEEAAAAAATLSLRGKTVLEIGAGCGLAGLVAAQLQQQRTDPLSNQEYELPAGPTPSQNDDSAKITVAAEPKVILTDFNPTVLANLKLNAALNDVDCEVVGLDFYQQTTTSNDDTGWVDANGRSRSRVDLVLGADIICQQSDAAAAAATVHCALKAGGDGVAYIVCADAEHRFGVDRFAPECGRLGLEVETRNAGDVWGGRLLREGGLEKTAGYVENMNMTLFTIRKRI